MNRLSWCLSDPGSHCRDDAYILGAQSVNPDIELRVVYVNAWFDPARETDGARALMDQGADVIAQHVDSPAAMQTRR